MEGVMIPILISLTLLASSAKVFAPPVLKEPVASPAAWFVEDIAHDRWCEFDSRRRAEAFGNSFGTSGPETPGAAWVRLKTGKLDSVTVQSTSEDAFVEDRYFFGPDGRVVEVRRTGAYAGDKPATFVLKANAAGKLVQTPETQALLKRLSDANYTTYFVNWDKYARFSDLPFATLISTQGGKVVIRSGCTTPNKPGHKRG